jgi:formamidopyrimidine-DNA glycosylase
MPELPEVETTCQGIKPYVVGNTVSKVIVREKQLRWAVSDELAQSACGLMIQTVTRRGKYCLLTTESGTVIIHLGMSGNLRIVNQTESVKKHDHVDFVFVNNVVLRFNDQRKFGAVLWTNEPIAVHPLLKNLGHEPLTADFNEQSFYQQCIGRRTAIKTLIMNGHIVVGVGNIYASEALFMAGISPLQPAGSLGFQDIERLTQAIKTVLERAIEQGGTTLRDFVNAAGKPGYFSQRLAVYGRGGLPCYQCQTLLEQVKISQRASYFCPLCQKLKC